MTGREEITTKEDEIGVKDKDVGRGEDLYIRRLATKDGKEESDETIKTENK